MKELILFGLFALFYSLHSVYPRSAKSSKLRLQIDNLRKGSYSVFLFNFMGRLVGEFQINIPDDNISQTVDLPPTFKRGTYNILITNGAVRVNRTMKVQ